MKPDLRDEVTERLADVYVCGRVWEAWSVGTMRQDDFSSAAEDDDLMDAVMDVVAEAEKRGAVKAAQYLLTYQAQGFHEANAAYDVLDDLRAEIGRIESGGVTLP